MDNGLPDLGGQNGPVILIEGRRSLPEGMAARLEGVGAWLAKTYPRAVFRSGNAEGSDTAFTLGVTAVDPARMQYVLPNPSMGRKRRHPDTPYYSLTDLSSAELEEFADVSIRVTPSIKSLAAAAVGRVNNGRLAAKGRYLLRDALKVLGAPSLDLPPAALALFYVDLDDPEAGGTGHTIRICRDQGVPVFFQDNFLQWGPP